MGSNILRHSGVYAGVVTYYNHTDFPQYQPISALHEALFNWVLYERAAWEAAPLLALLDQSLKVEKLKHRVVRQLQGQQAVWPHNAAKPAGFSLSTNAAPQEQLLSYYRRNMIIRQYSMIIYL